METNKKYKKIKNDNPFEIFIKKRGSLIITATFALIFFIYFVNIVGSTSLTIYTRLHTEKYMYAHDNPIQLEEAIKLILKGKNPYTENYFNTPLEKWGGWASQGPNINPALYHFISLPFHLLFSIPFYLISNFLLHWFDQRLVYFFSLFLIIALILKWPNKSPQSKFIFLACFIINPLFSPFFIEGRNDVFVFSWIVLSVYFLQLQKIKCSSLVLALAVTSKHSSWFILPFYFAYLYYLEATGLIFWQKIKNISKKTYPFFITAAIIIIPFLIWDFTSFIDDTINYARGTAYASFPIYGFGFSRLILQLNMVNSPNEYWPFWIPQLIFGLPLLHILLKMQKNNNAPAQMIFNFSLLLMTFWLFSRFFNDNYIGFLIMLFIFAIFTNSQKYPPYLYKKLKSA